MSTIKSQFKATLKKEWLEVVREKKLLSYILVAIGFMVVNIVFQVIFKLNIDTESLGVVIVDSNWYISQTTYNTFILGLNLVMVLVFTRNTVTKELKDKKMTVPYFLGLKPIVNITSKFIVQIFTPSVIAGLASVINACVTALILDNVTLLSPIYGQINITFGTMMMSSLMVFLSMTVYCLILQSLQALTRNGNIALAITLILLVFGDSFGEIFNIASIMPTMFYRFSISLVLTATMNQMILSSIITVSLIILLCVASILVYSDRNDYSL